MVLKRADADIVAEEPIAPPGGYSLGPYISPQTVREIPWALIDQLTISLGGGGLFPQTSAEPSYRISEMAEEPPTLQEAALPPEGDRRDQAPVQGELPVIQATDWVDYWRLRELASVDPSMGEILAPVTAVLDPIVPTEEEPMGILGDIYTAADTVLGGYLPNIAGYGVDPGYGVSLPALAFAAPTTGPAPLPVPLGGGGMVPPPPPSYGAMGCDPVDPYKGYVLKRHCGQWRWIKKKHRRRKQLFTQRDASQLSSLIGIAGKSVITKTWIASHPS